MDDLIYQKPEHPNAGKGLLEQINSYKGKYKQLTSKEMEKKLKEVFMELHPKMNTVFPLLTFSSQEAADKFVEDFNKEMKKQHLIFGSPGEMTPETQKKILQTFNNKIMTTEEQIKEVKQLRVNIDKNIQDVKTFQDIKKEKGHRELALVVTKLQEAKMWLGQVLAEIGATTPYPHADNPNNAIVEPTADTYQKNLHKSIGKLPLGTKYSIGQYTVSGAICPLVSVHFTTKGQSFESLNVLLAKLATTCQPNFEFTEGTVVLHTFLPKDTVIAKGYGTDIYDKLLDPYFPMQYCFYVEGALEDSRINTLRTIKESNGCAIFIGNITEGVKIEYDLAIEMGVRVLHFPHID